MGRPIVDISGQTFDSIFVIEFDHSNNRETLLSMSYCSSSGRKVL